MRQSAQSRHQESCCTFTTLLATCQVSTIESQIPPQMKRQSTSSSASVAVVRRGRGRPGCDAAPVFHPRRLGAHPAPAFRRPSRAPPATLPRADPIALCPGGSDRGSCSLTELAHRLCICAMLPTWRSQSSLQCMLSSVVMNVERQSRRPVAVMPRRRHRRPRCTLRSFASCRAWLRRRPSRS